MYKIAIVGAGAIGKSHSDAILKNPDCTLVAVADIAIEKAEKIANPHNAQVFTDYKEMCRSIEFDAVIINLPHYLHCESSMFFIEQGKHILVEKPMAMNVEECNQMIEKANECNVKLAVGHVQKYYSAYRKLKEFVDAGVLGKLCMVTETRNVDYTKNRPKWFLTKKLAGGGIIMNYGAHAFDKIMYVTGEKIEKVHSVMNNPVSKDDVEINAQILLELSGGVSAAITFCGCHVKSEYDIAFYFTDGVAKVAGGSQLTVIKNKESIEYGGTANLFDEQLNEFVKLLNGEKSEVCSGEYGREIIAAIEKTGCVS